MIGENKELKGAKQSKALSDVVLQASNTRPEKIKRKYVRPEDMLIGPNEMFPTKGTGTEFLARDGAKISTSGEIMNTYSPGDLYTNLGFEPLNETGKQRKFGIGGMLEDFAGTGVGQALVGGGGGPQAALLGGIGSLIGGGKGRQTGVS